MTEINLSKLEAILGDLLEMVESDRASALLELAARDPALADAVRRLLAIQARATRSLIEPPEEGLVQPGMDPDADPLVGSVLGEFKIVRLHGVGGMGRVYEARQQSPERRVALKVLSGHLLRRGSARRFAQEAEFLASLAHPGISRVIAAGSAIVSNESIPYLAMDFIDGRPLTEAARGMATAATLRLFAEVCDAVEHAHRNGVIHRDLKPANILVELDAQGRPHARVMDFGLARLVDVGRFTQTAEVGGILGTIDYMSPEQLGMGAANPDTRSDVYSLGVILYELLAGRRPFESGNMAGSAARIVSAAEPPRLKGIAPGTHAELDLIVSKAMAREPADRYGSAAALALDIRSHLESRPIAARPPTVLYSLTKYAVRHRGLSTGLVIAIAMLILGVAGTVFGLRQAVQARDQARSALAVSRFSQYSASIQAAQNAIKLGDTQEAQRHLESAPVEHRGWEWRFLRALSVPESLRGNKEGGIRHMPWEMMLGNPATRPYRQDRALGEIQLLDLETLELSQGMPGFGPNNRWRCSFTPDGTYFATAGASDASFVGHDLSEPALRVFERASGKQVGVQPGFQYEDRGFDVSDDGARLVIGGRSGVVRVFSIPDLTPLLEFQAAPEIQDTEFSMDGSLILVSGASGFLTIVRAADGSVVSQVDRLPSILGWPEISPDASRVYGVLMGHQTVVEIDVATGRVIRRADSPANIAVLTVFPDGERLAIGCWDGTIHLYPTSLPDGIAWAPLISLRESPSGVNAIFVSPDSRRMFVDHSTADDLVWDAGLRD